MKSKSHMKKIDRIAIEMAYREGESMAEIARMIGVSASTVSREIKQYGSEDGTYSAQKAHKAASRKNKPCPEK